MSRGYKYQSSGEINYIVEPCKNFERNVFKKKQAQEKKETKETTEAA